MVCERCGNDMSDNASICPVCGTVSARAKASAQPPTGYGQYPQSPFGAPPTYQQGYAPQPDANPSPQANKVPPPLQNASYAPPYQAAPVYQAVPINYAAASNFTLSNKNDGALIAEIILSLFGIFGVGWLMAGETTAGIILLVCSMLVYWPIMFLGTIVTFGLGLICLGPLAIGAIILNALLLNNTLKRKAVQFVVMQPPPMPPQY